MQHSRPIFVFKLHIHLLSILFLLPLLPHHCLLFQVVLLRLLLPLPPTPTGLFNGMLEVSKPEALNCYVFFRPILLTLSVSRKTVLTHLSLSRFLDSLLCILIAFTSSLAFFLEMPPTLAGASSFLSGRADSYLNFLPSLFLRLTSTLIM